MWKKRVEINVVELARSNMNDVGLGTSFGRVKLNLCPMIARFWQHPFCVCRINIACALANQMSACSGILSTQLSFRKLVERGGETIERTRRFLISSLYPVVH